MITLSVSVLSIAQNKNVKGLIKADNYVLKESGTVSFEFELKGIYPYYINYQPELTEDDGNSEYTMSVYQKNTMNGSWVIIADETYSQATTSAFATSYVIADTIHVPCKLKVSFAANATLQTTTVRLGVNAVEQKPYK